MQLCLLAEDVCILHCMFNSILFFFCIIWCQNRKMPRAHLDSGNFLCSCKSPTGRLRAYGGYINIKTYTMNSLEMIEMFTLHKYVIFHRTKEKQRDMKCKSFRSPMLCFSKPRKRALSSLNPPKG